MTVYVDDMYRDNLGRFGRMKMSHLIADTDDELHAMADLIGVDRRFHQKADTYYSHYDISLSKRNIAVDAGGAVEITMKQCAAMCARRRETGQLGDPADALAWYRSRPRLSRLVDAV